MAIRLLWICLLYTSWVEECINNALIEKPNIIDVELEKIKEMQDEIKYVPEPFEINRQHIEEAKALSVNSQSNIGSTNYQAPDHVLGDLPEHLDVGEDNKMCIRDSLQP